MSELPAHVLKYMMDRTTETLKPSEGQKINWRYEFLALVLLAMGNYFLWVALPIIAGAK